MPAPGLAGVVRIHNFDYKLNTTAYSSSPGMMSKGSRRGGKKDPRTINTIPLDDLGMFAERSDVLGDQCTANTSVAALFFLFSPLNPFNLLGNKFVSYSSAMTK